jgi:hypothetical protein
MAFVCGRRGTRVRVAAGGGGDDDPLHLPVRSVLSPA